MAKLRYDLYCKNCNKPPVKVKVFIRHPNRKGRRIGTYYTCTTKCGDLGRSEIGQC